MNGSRALSWLTGLLAILPAIAALASPFGDLELAVRQAWFHELQGTCGTSCWLERIELSPRVELLGTSPTVFYRPVAMVSALLDWLVAPDQAWPARLSNLLLSAGSAVLLAEVLRSRVARTRQWVTMTFVLWWWFPSWVATEVTIHGRADVLLTFCGSGALFCWWKLHFEGARRVFWAPLMAAGAAAALTHELGALLALALPLFGLLTFVQRRLVRRASNLHWSIEGQAAWAATFGIWLCVGAFALSRHASVPLPSDGFDPSIPRLASQWWNVHRQLFVPWTVAETCPPLPHTSAWSLEAVLGALVWLTEALVLLRARASAGLRALSWAWCIVNLDVLSQSMLGSSVGRAGPSWIATGTACTFWLAQCPVPKRLSQLRHLGQRWPAALGNTLLSAALLLLFLFASVRSVLAFDQRWFWQVELARCPEQPAVAFRLAHRELVAGSPELGLARSTCAWNLGLAQGSPEVAGEALASLLRAIRVMTPLRLGHLVDRQAKELTSLLSGKVTTLSYGRFELRVDERAVEQRAIDHVRPELMMLAAEAHCDQGNRVALEIARRAVSGCRDCPDISEQAMRVALRFEEFATADALARSAGLFDAPFFGHRSYRAFVKELRALHEAATQSDNQFLLLNFDLMVGNGERAFRRIQSFPQLTQHLERERSLQLARLAYHHGFSDWTARLIRRHLSRAAQAEFLGQMVFETPLVLPPRESPRIAFDAGQCERWELLESDRR